MAIYAANALANQILMTSAVHDHTHYCLAVHHIPS
jgi:hypothetical protein